jgi:hypothetical protein
MCSSIRAARSALMLVTGAVALVAVAARAEAQRTHPRSGVLVEPQPVAPTVPYPGASVTIDPRRTTHRLVLPRYPFGSNTGNTVVLYQAGYGYPIGPYGYPVGSYGGTYDVNGRPLSIGFDAGPSAGAVPSYTPDLSGSPYVVIEGGAMLADMPNGERRTFPSCAAQSASRDPDGRPRTVFYAGEAEGVVLRDGQRGRVQGTPASGARACYTIDSIGRVALSY